MTRLFSFLLLLALPGLAQAACYADYKAKQDDPLRLHYGVAEISGECTIEAASAELAPRLGAAGWELLTLMGTFDEAGLEERKNNAGEYFLRF